MHNAQSGATSTFPFLSVEDGGVLGKAKKRVSNKLFPGTDFNTQTSYLNFSKSFR